jgi:tRNA(Ile)-lysidine synthase TilS/MesJ
MKALCVYSGGLDSTLAAAVMRAQSIEVLALFFETPFFSASRAEKSAQASGLPFRVVNITRRHLEILKNPRHGYGRHMNPCIDCHTLMFRIAGELLEEEGARFVVTGEVLGQRPMSQNKGALNLIARESGLGERLLRPLSAKHLPVTLPEKEGWVNRDLLLDFNGRSRKPQMALARHLNITEYPAPAGGCLLTEKDFSNRLRDLLSSKPDPETREFELLKIGRHFRVAPHCKLIVGRNKVENDAIVDLAGREDFVLSTVSVPGPTVLVSGQGPEDGLPIAAAVTAAYSDAQGKVEVQLRVGNGRFERRMVVGVRDKAEFKHLIL